MRLATHATFRTWVEGFGLDFYPLGGDPKVLPTAWMGGRLTSLPIHPAYQLLVVYKHVLHLQILSEFIVKNGGVVPKPTEMNITIESTRQVRGGEVHACVRMSLCRGLTLCVCNAAHAACHAFRCLCVLLCCGNPLLCAAMVPQVKEVLVSSYPACTQPDPEDPLGRPFTAQAIISNPPVYGHIHVAEKLGVPLHLVFTMPLTPTREFCCPFSASLRVRSMPAAVGLSLGVEHSRLCGHSEAAPLNVARWDIQKQLL